MRLVVDRLLEGLLLVGGDARLILEAAHRFRGGEAHFVFEPGELAGEFLHARMAGQQRAPLLGDLRLQSHARLGETAQRIVARRVGDRIEAALAQKIGKRARLSGSPPTRPSAQRRAGW